MAQLHRNIKDKAWLKLYCLDVDENILKTDSVSIVNVGEWKQFSIEIEANKTEKLYIEIEAKSKDMSLSSLKEGQKLWIDKCQIHIDGIDHKNFPNTPKVKNNRARSICELDSSLRGVELIDDIKVNRIIALGESVHGSLDMQYCTFEFIKHLIQHEKCRLVLFELNFELGMWLNEYVLGEIEEENIKERMILYNYDYQSFVNLLKWIKNFNETNQEKVRICGFDENISITKLQGIDHLIDFVKYKRIVNDSFTIIYEYIKKKEYNKAIEYILEKNNLNELDSIERISLIRALELRQKKYNPNPSILDGDREYIQFQNAKFAINYLLSNSSKAVIYAHLGHVNKLNSIIGRINISNFGKYMHEYFVDNYFVIALLTGNGTVTNSKDGENLSILPLKSAIDGSLEKQLMASESSFYYVRTAILEQAYLIRTIGFGNNKNQFYPSSFKNKFDAVIFIRNSKGYY